MNEKELQVIKETEDLCRIILSEAEEESKEIILKAKKEADIQYKSLINDSMKQGETILSDAEANNLKQRNQLLKELEKEVEAIKNGRSLSIEDASYIIFERMWMRGNCQNV